MREDPFKSLDFSIIGFYIGRLIGQQNNMARKRVKKKTKAVKSSKKKRVLPKKSVKAAFKTKAFSGAKKTIQKKIGWQKRTPTLPVKGRVDKKVGLEKALMEELRVKIISETSTVPRDKDSDTCVMEGCEENKTTGDFCRLHYISKWKRLKKKERVLAEKRLNKYIEELTARYPDEYLEVIKRDLSSDKNFSELLQDLEIEDVDEVVGVDEEDEDFGKKFRPEDDEGF